ncbi:MAG: 2-oxo acid dehydrogenase subunit E2 [Pseudomonadales bacterium]|nr:2-oxo acid dehydrogenase subunit E2 [Pseudomonadales bacterium]
MSNEQEVHVPDMGDFDSVAVIDVLVKAGDKIEVDTPLLTLETDKATMDVPSTVAGEVQKVHVAKGDNVRAGDLIATVKADAAAPVATTATAAVTASAGTTALSAQESTTPTPPQVSAAPKSPDVATAAQSAQRPVGAAVDELGFSRAHASPSVRKLARELGVDLGRVKGSGDKGRVLHDDVKAFVKTALASGAGARGAALPKVPSVDFAAFGKVDIRPLSRVQKISGPRLHASWVNLPHVTQFDEADITELERTRKSLKKKTEAESIKLTPLAFILRACVQALQQFPLINASLDESGENLVVKKYIHLGFAADTPGGLLVPVIRDADRKDIYELARSLGELSEKARDGKLVAADMQGGTFTISSLGGIGGTAFTPIINAPEVAILGVSRAALKPIFNEQGGFVPRLMLPLSFSYDHRVVDGAAAVRFTTYLAAKLADVKGLIEAVP